MYHPLQSRTIPKHNNTVSHLKKFLDEQGGGSNYLNASLEFRELLTQYNRNHSDAIQKLDTYLSKIVNKNEKIKIQLAVFKDSNTCLDKKISLLKEILDNDPSDEIYKKTPPLVFSLIKNSNNSDYILPLCDLILKLKDSYLKNKSIKILLKKYKLDSTNKIEIYARNFSLNNSQKNIILRSRLLVLETPKEKLETLLLLSNPEDIKNEYLNIKNKNDEKQTTEVILNFINDHAFHIDQYLYLIFKIIYCIQNDIVFYQIFTKISRLLDLEKYLWVMEEVKKYIDGTVLPNDNYILTLACIKNYFNGCSSKDDEAIINSIQKLKDDTFKADILFLIIKDLKKSFDFLNHIFNVFIDLIPNEKKDQKLLELIQAIIKNAEIKDQRNIALIEIIINVIIDTDKKNEACLDLFLWDKLRAKNKLFFLTQIDKNSKHTPISIIEKKIQTLDKNSHDFHILFNYLTFLKMENYSIRREHQKIRETLNVFLEQDKMIDDKQKSHLWKDSFYMETYIEVFLTAGLYKELLNSIFPLLENPDLSLKAIDVIEYSIKSTQEKIEQSPSLLVWAEALTHLLKEVRTVVSFLQNRQSERLIAREIYTEYHKKQKKEATYNQEIIHLSQFIDDHSNIAKWVGYVFNPKEKEPKAIIQGLNNQFIVLQNWIQKAKPDIQKYASFNSKEYNDNLNSFYNRLMYKTSDGKKYPDYICQRLGGLLNHLGSFDTQIPPCAATLTYLEALFSVLRVGAFNCEDNAIVQLDEAQIMSLAYAFQDNINALISIGLCIFKRKIIQTHCIRHFIANKEASENLEDYLSVLQYLQNYTSLGPCPQTMTYSEIADTSPISHSFKKILEKATIEDISSALLSCDDFPYILKYYGIPILTADNYFDIECVAEQLRDICQKKIPSQENISSIKSLSSLKHYNIHAIICNIIQQEDITATQITRQNWIERIVHTIHQANFEKALPLLLKDLVKYGYIVDKDVEYPIPFPLIDNKIDEISLYIKPLPNNPSWSI